MRHLPTRTLCILLLLLQGAIIDYYLVTNKSMYWVAWAAADVAVIVVFLVAFIWSYRQLRHAKRFRTASETTELPLGYITWLVYATVLSVKVAIIFKEFSFLLDEASFFGPNTCKTTIALAGIVFLLFLSAHHEAKPGTEQKRYIEELTGTVVFDILDGVDSMEILFRKEIRDTFPPGLDDAIIAIACINFLLPTVALFTLSRTKFGVSKLQQKLVMLHKLILAFAVNLPLLVTRMIQWHGFSMGVSIFSLKNVIVIGMVSFDFYEHKEGEEAAAESREEKQPGNDSQSQAEPRPTEMPMEDFSLENRFNYV